MKPFRPNLKKTILFYNQPTYSCSPLKSRILLVLSVLTPWLAYWFKGHDRKSKSQQLELYYAGVFKAPSFATALLEPRFDKYFENLDKI